MHNGHCGASEPQRSHTYIMYTYNTCIKLAKGLLLLWEIQDNNVVIFSR